MLLAFGRFALRAHTAPRAHKQAMPNNFAAMPLSARSRQSPLLPSLYDVPWSTREPMFPRASTPRAPDAEAWVASKRKLRPVKLQSTFGMQVDSRRASPIGTVFSNAGQRPPPSPEIAIASPGPLTYKLVPSCGEQVLSPFLTAARVSLRMKEDRWLPMERVQRLNSTPAPSAYFPK